MKEDLKNKFKHIGFLDYKIVDKELSKYTTIEEKLEYWKEIKANYFDKFKLVLKNLNEDEQSLYYKDQNKIRKRIFGDCELTPDLGIQEPIFSKHFKNEIHNPDYTSWLLKYKANELFESNRDSQRFKDELKSPFKKELLQASLNQIIEIENKAKELLKDNEFSYFDDYRAVKGYLWTNNPNIELIEVLRVLADYYKDYVTQPNLNTFKENPIADDVKAYATHIFLKPYLQNELEKIKNGDNKTLDIISGAKLPTFDEDVNKILELIKPLGGYWAREIILKEEDFNTFRNYVLEIAKTGNLPSELKEFPVTSVSNQFISKTIYLVYCYLGKKYRNQWIDLIKSFRQFRNTEKETIDKKFSNFTGDYNRDILMYINYKKVI